MSNRLQKLGALGISLAFMGCSGSQKSLEVQETSTPQTTVETTQDTVSFPVDSSLERIYEIMEGNYYGAAMIFVDSFSESLDYIRMQIQDEGWMNEAYPFFADIAAEQYVAAASNGELYCVIPGSKNAKVTVYEWLLTEENGYEGEFGDIVYQSDDGRPFFLMCNISDILPDSRIIIEDGESVFDFVPYRSLENGMIAYKADEPYLLDLTQYEDPYTGAVGLPNEYVGNYEANLRDPDGVTGYLLSLTFTQYGQVIYTYTMESVGSDAIMHSYFGVWDGDPDSTEIVFDLINDEDETDELHFVMDMRVNSDALEAFVMKFVSGDNILPMVLNPEKEIYFYPWYYTGAKG